MIRSMLIPMLMMLLRMLMMLELVMVTGRESLVDYPVSWIAIADSSCFWKQVLKSVGSLLDLP